MMATQVVPACRGVYREDSPHAVKGTLAPPCSWGKPLKRAPPPHPPRRTPANEHTHTHTRALPRPHPHLQVFGGLVTGMVVK